MYCVRASWDQTCRLWDGQTGDCLYTFSETKGPIFAMAFSPDRRFIATGTCDGGLYIYDLKVSTVSRRLTWKLTNSTLHRRGRSVGHGSTTTNVQGSSKLAGSKWTIRTGWRLRLSRRRLELSTSLEYHHCSEDLPYLILRVCCCHTVMVV